MDDGQCPAEPPHIPAWVRSLQNAPEGLGRLGGLWVKMDRSVARPGVLERPPLCYGGFEGVALVQEGDTVQAFWIYRPPASGAARRVLVHKAGFQTGCFDGKQLHLDGYLDVTVREMDTHGKSRDCHPTRSELRLDARTGHLSGTFNGAEIYLVPVRFVAPGNFECGPPPP